jgi:prepilin-type processing-associated H-X9-DG protein
VSKSLNPWGGPAGAGAFAAARSAHPGGVNVSMVDGSITFISNDVDTDVWRASGTRKWQEVLKLQ